MRRRALTLALTLLLTLASATVSSACPSCKNSIPNSDAQTATGVPSGFNFSVYYMLVGVFGVAGVLVTMLVREARRSQR